MSPAARCRAARAPPRVPPGSRGTRTLRRAEGGGVSCEAFRSLYERELQFSKMRREEIVFVRRQIAGRFVLEHGDHLDHLPRRGDVDLRLLAVRIAQHAERDIRL